MLDHQVVQELHDSIAAADQAIYRLQTADEKAHFLTCIEKTARLLKQLWQGDRACHVGGHRYLARYGELEVDTYAGPYTLSRAAESSVPVTVGLQFVRDLRELLYFVGLRSLALNLTA